MGLQIDRSVVGDILVHDEGADIIVLEGGQNLVALEMIMQRIQNHIDTP